MADTTDSNFFINCGRTQVLLVELTKPRTLTGDQLIEELRALAPHVEIQAVKADLVAGTEHIRGVLEQALEARKQGILLAKRIEVDLLLRLACTNQIERALERIGIDERTTTILLIGIGNRKYLKQLMSKIQSRFGVKLSLFKTSERKLRRIASLHEISEAELDALIGNGNKIAKVLVERASLL